ncbi:hypothetical protein CEUSTIGMA_g1885.t1 [Chlamydomonas eustigma]|uniref:CBS domain-containing protein n=1 Tax=Chlamydomonas eustigma TaxID=1157962 RepID=A0A250WUK3_9CHLO|nr:hypothetical protein CEUSTIGMA_g1885.t1 [Chlamydomonas eustigma]|eukprot:GAX74436.1 hypothetical protein CEUSTIGMA_g1885.t1 [Chlamydomonas eustigma]
MLFDQIREFLNSQDLTNFIQSNPHPLAVVEKNASVGSAFQLLQTFKVLSLPVVDEDGQYAGAISVNDILKGLHRSLVANLGDNFVDEVEQGNVTVDDINNVGFFFIGKQVSTLMHDSTTWMRGHPNSTLLTAVTDGFQIRGPRVHHRIYICDPSKPQQKVIKKSPSANLIVLNIEHGTEKEGASSWRPTDVVAQSDVVKFMWEHREALGLTTTLSLEDLELHSSHVLTVDYDTPAIVAFDHMAVDHKSSIGIVDGDGKLIGSLNASDIRDVPLAYFALLLLPVYQYMAVVYGFGPSLNQVMEGVPVEGTPQSLLAKMPPVVVKPSTTFGDLLQKLVTTNYTSHSHYRGLHRAYVVDEHDKPVSIVTLTDVLRTIIKFDEPVAVEDV